MIHTGSMKGESHGNTFAKFVKIRQCKKFPIIHSVCYTRPHIKNIVTCKLRESWKTYSTAQVLKSFSSLGQSTRRVHGAVNWLKVHPQTPIVEHRPIEKKGGGKGGEKKEKGRERGGRRGGERRRERRERGRERGREREEERERKREREREVNLMT